MSSKPGVVFEPLILKYMCEHFIGGLCNVGFTAESVFVFITINNGNGNDNGNFLIKTN
jgi:hypothetical protein